MVSNVFQETNAKKGFNGNIFNKYLHYRNQIGSYILSFAIYLFEMENPKLPLEPTAILIF